MDPESILSFWFEECRPWQWFCRREDFDALVRRRFLEATEAALKGDLRRWEDGPDRALALVLLLDQFPRQLFRGQAKAFAGDRRAVGLSLKALRQGWVDDQAERARRQFWLMPLLHSEDADLVARAIPLLQRYSDEATAALARRNLQQLQEFGRYPRRNQALGRVSTEEELRRLDKRQQRLKG